MWDQIRGQDRAVDQITHSLAHPVHAYLFIGPEGCGKEEAARAFAGALLSDSSDASDRINDMALRGVHPDIHEIERDGASILKDKAEEVIRIAAVTPTEGARKAIIMHEVHLMHDTAAARLLKTIEEPPPGVFFILLAERIADDLVTIASRCMTIHFSPLSNETLIDILVSEGATAENAMAAAKSSHGSLSRARLLVTDHELAHRREFFANIPRRIDGTGATVIAIVEQMMALIDESVEPLQRQHEQEIADLDEVTKLTGTKRSGKKTLEDKHKRELRRHRTDELRDGLTEIAGVYRDELATKTDILRPESYVVAIDRIHEAMRRLSLNVNEGIMLRDLIWALPSPQADAALQYVLHENA